MFHLFKKPKVNYLIQEKNEFGWQVIDIADTKEEAKDLLHKYHTKYPDTEYKIKINPKA